MELLFNPVFIWACIGAILFVLEFIVSSLVLVFFGAGAWVVALYSCFVKSPVEQEVIVFLFCSLALMIAFRKRMKDKFFKAKETAVFDKDYIGHTAKATTDFKKNEVGRVEYNGAPWQALSEFDIEEGQLVEIEKKERITLIVKPLS